MLDGSVPQVTRGSRALRGALIGALLFALLGTVLALPPSIASADPDPVEVQLCIILDGSGSILPEEWGLIVNGLADAIGNDTCTPTNGELELTVIIFGWLDQSQGEYGHAEVALPPTPITVANVAGIVDSIRDL